MLFNNLKKFIKKFPPLWKFLTWSMDCLIVLSRLKDVLMMMILFHVWPEQTYRFSTRKFLPCKKNRFSKESRPVIPYDLLKSKSSNIPIMKEINAVGLGSSFDKNNIKDLKGPIFLLPAYGPLRIDNNGKVFYRHNYNLSYAKGKRLEVEELINDQSNKEYKQNNITYCNSRESIIKAFKKNGNKVIAINIYGTDKDGNHYPNSDEREASSYLNLFDHDQCKHIAIAEKIFKHPLLPPNPCWMYTGSFIPIFCALTFFAEKINVYGWDFYLDSSPENMSYWQLFFNMYKFKLDKIRSRTHFEEALLSFYYGYQFSKLPNIKIHGYMGKLGKHHRLIKRIEKVLFN